MHIRVLHKQRPIEPILFVVLTVGVVVPVLGSANLITHQKHGKTKRKHGDGHEILDLAGSESLNFSIRGGTLDPTVPAPIVIAAVTVFFTVGFVVFVIVGDEVVERKSVVTGNEVHALLRFAFLAAIDLMTAKQPVREMSQRAIFTTKETSYVIPKTTVPFLPTVTNKAAHLVKSGSIPRFGNYLCAGERWI